MMGFPVRLRRAIKHWEPPEQMTKPQRLRAAIFSACAPDISLWYYF